MVIVASCDGCQQKYVLPPEAAGETKTCRQCGKDFKIPGGFKRLVWKPSHNPSSRDERHRATSIKVMRPPRFKRWPAAFPTSLALQWLLLGGGCLLALLVATQVDRFRLVSRRFTDGHFADGYVAPNPNDVPNLGEQIFADSVPAVVLITAYDEDDRKLGRGTGFFLHPGDWLVTNEHVVDGADHVVVDTYWRRRIKIDMVLARDRKMDLAILPVPASFRPDVLRLASRAHAEGETVFAIGSPSRTRFGISQGVLVQQGYLRGGVRQLIQADISVSPGSSGSPLLDRQGDVVGVVAMASPSEKKFTFAIHQEELRELMARAGPPRRLNSSYQEDESLARELEDLTASLSHFGWQ